MGPPSLPGARMSVIREASRIVAAPAGKLGHRQQAEVRERMVDPPAAERPHDHDALRAPSQGRADGKFRVGFVLVRLAPLDRDARGLERRQRLVSDRVAVADPQVEVDSQRSRVPGATVRRDGQPDAVVPARPGQIELRPRRRVAVGQDEGQHRRDATPRSAATARC